MSSKKSSQAHPYRCPPWPPSVDPAGASTSAAVAAELQTLLTSGAWGKYQPPILQRLRRTIADFLGCRHVRLAPSGSAAVELALRATAAMDTPAAPGTTSRPSAAEVICPALDYPGNARAVRLLGAIPVFVDVAPGRWTIDTAAVEAAGTPQTVAVIASHLYGQIAPVAPLRELCDRRGWILLEDVCQMPGGRIDDRPLGTFGHVAVWSFGGSKPLTAGCGGAITTDDERIAQRLAAFADRPSDAYPLSPLQAAVLLPQWIGLPRLVETQNGNLARLVQAVGRQLPEWSLPATTVAPLCPLFYKIPLTIAGSTDTPQPHDGGPAPPQIVEMAQAIDIPAGLVFRIPGKLSPSRGRIESCENAQRMANRSWLIDHRVLATDHDGIDRLAAALIRLHESLYH